MDNTYLYGAKLAGSRFSGARLAYVNAYRVDVSDAEMQQTNIYGANLSAARFNGAFLYQTRLTGSYVDDATFAGARFD